MTTENDNILTTQHNKLEKLNQKMKEMSNRIALLEASLLNKMAMDGGGSVSESASRRGDGLTSSAPVNNSSVNESYDSEANNYILRKRTFV